MFDIMNKKRNFTSIHTNYHDLLTLGFFHTPHMHPYAYHFHSHSPDFSPVQEVSNFQGSATSGRHTAASNTIRRHSLSVHTVKRCLFFLPIHPSDARRVHMICRFRSRRVRRGTRLFCHFLLLHPSSAFPNPCYLSITLQAPIWGMLS